MDNQSEEELSIGKFKLYSYIKKLEKIIEAQELFQRLDE